MVLKEFSKPLYRSFLRSLRRLNKVKKSNPCGFPFISSSALEINRIYHTFLSSNVREFPSDFAELHNTYWVASYGVFGAEYCHLSVSDLGWQMTKVLGDVNVPDGEMAWKTKEQIDEISFAVEIHRAEENFQCPYFTPGTLTVVDDHELEVFRGFQKLSFKRVMLDPNILGTDLRNLFLKKQDEDKNTNQILQYAFDCLKDVNERIDSLEKSMVTNEQNSTKLNNHFEKLYNEPEEKREGIIRNIWDIWLNHSSETVNELFKQGLDFAKYGKSQEAIDIFNQVLELDPLYAEAWNRRSLCNFKVCNMQHALHDIQRCLELEPRHFGALYGAVQICRHQSDVQLELEYLEELIKIVFWDRQLLKRRSEIKKLEPPRHEEPKPHIPKPNKQKQPVKVLDLSKTMTNKNNRSV